LAERAGSISTSRQINRQRFFQSLRRVVVVVAVAVIQRMMMMVSYTSRTGGKKKLTDVNAHKVCGRRHHTRVWIERPNRWTRTDAAS
jgi:hypothetical protein